MSALTNTETITYGILRTDSVTGEVIVKSNFGDGLTYQEVLDIARSEPKRLSWRGNPITIQVTTQRTIITEEVTTTL